MISNVNFNASAPYSNVSRQPDEKALEVQSTVAVEATDKIEISNHAKSAVQAQGRSPASQYFMEVFSVNFWERGVSEAYEMALEALRASIVADNNDLEYFESLLGEKLTDEYAKANFLIEDFNPSTAGASVSSLDITVED